MGKPIFKRTFPIFDSVALDFPSMLDSEVKFFDVDNVAAYWMKSDQIDFDLEKDFGPLRLPYPECWFEHDMHRNESQIVTSDDGRRGTAGIPALGWKLLECEPGHELRVQDTDLHPDEYVIIGWVVDERRLFGRCGIVVWVTESGEYLDARIIMDYDSQALRVLGQENLAYEIKASFKPIAMAIGLFNCKNIETEARPFRPASKRKTQGPANKATEYRVIKLPGAPRNRATGGTGEHVQMKHHTVRGHFKTYTSDKPLYGRLVGTWWWSPAVRGDRRNGEIISSYSA